jgi:cytochrome P450
MNLDRICRPLEFVKRRLAVPSFTSTLLQSNLNSLDRKTLPFAAASLFGGGTDTVVATISTFILAMVLFPDVQRKAQEEIDRVIGTGRLPNFTDRDHLPYLSALYKELF